MHELSVDDDSEDYLSRRLDSRGFHQSSAYDSDANRADTEDATGLDFTDAIDSTATNHHQLDENENHYRLKHKRKKSKNVSEVKIVTPHLSSEYSSDESDEVTPVESCPRCSLRFSSLKDKYVHLKKIHSGVSDLIRVPGPKSSGSNCRKCKLDFKSKPEYQSHLFEAHSISLLEKAHPRVKERNLKLSYRTETDNGSKIHYKCPKCKHVTSDRKLLRIHLKSVHGKAKRHKCEKCKRLFAENDNIHGVLDAAACKVTCNFRCSRM